MIGGGVLAAPLVVLDDQGRVDGRSWAKGNRSRRGWPEHSRQMVLGDLVCRAARAGLVMRSRTDCNMATGKAERRWPSQARSTRVSTAAEGTA